MRQIGVVRYLTCVRMASYCSQMDTPTPSTALAEVVKIALKDAGVSRRDAASSTGIPLTTLSRRLTGNSPFLVTELAALASVAGTTVSALFADAETRDTDGAA